MQLLERRNFPQRLQALVLQLLNLLDHHHPFKTSSRTLVRDEVRPVVPPCFGKPQTPKAFSLPS